MLFHSCFTIEIHQHTKDVNDACRSNIWYRLQVGQEYKKCTRIKLDKHNAEERKV